MRRAAAFLLVIGLALAAPAHPAHAATVRSANAVVFTHDRWHPGRTVVGSSSVLTRTAGTPVLVTIAAAPAGRTVTFTATVRNLSTRSLAFGRRGLRVEGVVVRNGRGQPSWTLLAPRTRSLASGAMATLSGRFDLPKPGTYTVEGLLRS